MWTKFTTVLCSTNQGTAVKAQSKLLTKVLVVTAVQINYRDTIWLSRSSEKIGAMLTKFGMIGWSLSCSTVAWLGNWKGINNGYHFFVVSFIIKRSSRWNDTNENSVATWCYIQGPFNFWCVGTIGLGHSWGGSVMYIRRSANFGWTDSISTPAKCAGVTNFLPFYMNTLFASLSKI